MLYIEVTRAFGLTVSTQKTKLMVYGPNIEEEEKSPIQVGNSIIKCVESFTHLGSAVSSNAKMDVEVDRCIASASKAFGAVRQAAFRDKNLSITTKRCVY